MNTPPITMRDLADRLAALYERPFGGKPKGRFRVSTKLVRQLTGRRRLYEDDLRELGREMFERGYVLVDMDGFLAVLAANAFVNFRRVNEDALG